MARPRTTPVSVTPEARDALREIAVEITVATRDRATLSDSLTLALAMVQRHRDEIAELWAGRSSASA